MKTLGLVLIAVGHLLAGPAVAQEADNPFKSVIPAPKPPPKPIPHLMPTPAPIPAPVPVVVPVPPPPPPRPVVKVPELVALPTGLFSMGSNDDASEKPVHGVGMNKVVEFGKYPVTFDEWDACVEDGGCNGFKPSDEGWGRGRRPVINVSFTDAEAYVAWLKERTGQQWRLPTEAEWEFAARAGTAMKYSWGNAIGTAKANCDGCGSAWDKRQTSPVGSFQASPFGLYDMGGNVWQWVADCFSESYANAPADGSAVTAGDCARRVIRGGFWGSPPDSLRAASRSWHSVGTRRNYLGFRVARTPPGVS